MKMHKKEDSWEPLDILEDILNLEAIFNYSVMALTQRREETP